MDVLSGIWNYGIVAILVLTVVVFVHEAGHFWVARWNGVKIEVFSIGFGPEIFGWHDRHGTRWRISLLPLGGYVRMFGDADEASVTSDQAPMTDEEKAVSFKHKTVFQRAMIVFAGPAANFVFAVFGMTFLFMVYGQAVIDPVIGQVYPGTAAEKAGILAGDRIVSINGTRVDRFQDIQRIVRLEIEKPLDITLDRAGASVAVTVMPQLDAQKVPRLGISAGSAGRRVATLGPFSAFTEALRETETQVTSQLVAMGQMLRGSRSSDELGGVMRIAKGTGDAAQHGLAGVLDAMIFLSLALGIINLFPIPVLDGGHLVFYAFEAILGRPLSEKTQEYSFRIGLFLVLALMVLANGNDFVSFGLWDAVKRLFL